MTSFTAAAAAAEAAYSSYNVTDKRRSGDVIIAANDYSPA